MDFGGPRKRGRPEASLNGNGGFKKSRPVMQESTDQHGTSYTPMVKNGLKGLERTLAAVLLVVQISSPLPIIHWGSYSVPPAKVVLYSPDTKVPRTGELALRRAVSENSNMKTIQDSLEELLYLLRIPQRKPYGTMEGNVKKALKELFDENMQ